MNAPTPHGIIDFWFGKLRDDTEIANAQAGLWWAKSADTDALIRHRFEAAVQSAARGDLQHWRTTSEGCLALVILTDQFPRNIYRDTPQAFAFDAQARQLCVEGIDAGHDQSLRLIERVFFYLPLEHSEQRDDQARCVMLMRQLVDAASAPHKALYEGYLDFARRHQVIIDRFGRFPHRNAILGRQSSAEEHDFLQQPGSGF